MITSFEILNILITEILWIYRKFGNFASVLFLENFEHAKFRENKTLQYGEITQPFTDICKSRLSREF